jgi:hypothetical protein
MSFTVVKNDLDTADWYCAAKTAGYSYASEWSEQNLSAFVTRFAPDVSVLWAVHDGFADGMREATTDSLSIVRDAFKLINGAAA